MWPQTRQMKESTKLELAECGFAVSGMDKVELRSCEKLACGPGRRNRLPNLPYCPRVCKLGGAGGFACRANSSHLLTLVAMWKSSRSDIGCWLCLPLQLLPIHPKSDIKNPSVKKPASAPVADSWAVRRC